MRAYHRSRTSSFYVSRLFPVLFCIFFFDDVFVPCTPIVAAERQSYMAAMTVSYIKECKEFNFQLPLKLPVEPPLGARHCRDLPCL